MKSVWGPAADAFFGDMELQFDGGLLKPASDRHSKFTAQRLNRFRLSVRKPCHVDMYMGEASSWFFKLSQRRMRMSSDLVSLTR